jgi:hypothetical protein
MPSRSQSNRPNKLDKVWYYNGGQPLNGYVWYINWRSDDRDVYVKFYDNETISFPLSDFKDNYQGNDQWLLSKFDYECHLDNIKSGAWMP